MRTGIVAFLLGNVFLLYRPELPLLQSIYWLAGLALLLSILLYKFRHLIVRYCSFCHYLSSLFLFFLTGFVYTGWYIHTNVAELELQHREGISIHIVGVVVSMPVISDRRQRFDFNMQGIVVNDTLDKSLQPKRLFMLDKSFSGKVRLNWYQQKSIPKMGQRWQFEVRLKKPNGSLNPGGFDYEKYLFQNRILATGYVRNSSFNRQLDKPRTEFIPVAELRQRIAEKLDRLLADYPYKGLVKALSLGIKGDIDHSQWKTFIDTGTNHLIAISGLHIGLMASITWIMFYWLWRLSNILNRSLPAFYVASAAAFLMACFYAALAGFAIPTQRALIMLGVVFIVASFKRELPVSYILLDALLIVLLIDPLSSLSSGFWLSFGAVAVILFAFANRLPGNSTGLNILIYSGLMQWRIFIGLIPIMLILLHQLSIISPLANYLAVPLMSFVIIPLTLLATLLSLFYEPLANVLFLFLDWPIRLLFWWLQWLNTSALTELGLTNTGTVWYLTDNGWFSIVLIVIGSLWLLMPKGVPGRWLGVVLCLPALLNTVPQIEPGNVQVSILDVGQGLAVVVQTANHSLLYDTGDKYSETFNFADQVIIPFARISGIQRFDKVIVSHGDKDHAGSINEILSAMAVEELSTSEPERLIVKDRKFSQNKNICAQGQRWQWDKVNFQFLSPEPLKNYHKSNNRSCVLLITLVSGQSFLLTGDIEKDTEKQILKSYPELRADVLLIPHHGSKTSSSAAFIRQLNPDIAIFSTGYRNRFHFPAKKILKRYQSMNIKLFNTTNGALEITSNISNNSLSIKQFRYSDKHFWHRTAEHF
jgi:competence protein ComEC